jgi:hypothetical protein
VFDAGLRAAILGNAKESGGWGRKIEFSIPNCQCSMKNIIDK